MSKQREPNTVVALFRDGREVSRIQLKYDDATTEEIARSAIAIVQSRMSLDVGDELRVFELSYEKA